jgi:hypothetical protein
MLAKSYGIGATKRAMILKVFLANSRAHIKSHSAFSRFTIKNCKFIIMDRDLPLNVQ